MIQPDQKTHRRGENVLAEISELHRGISFTSIGEFTQTEE